MTLAQLVATLAVVVFVGVALLALSLLGRTTAMHHTIASNLRRWDREHRWPKDGDEWDGQARGQSYDEWKRSLIKAFLTPNVTAESVVLEIAPGHGRWSRELAPMCRRLVLVDVSPSCVDYCRALFRGQPHVHCVLTDGRSLPGVDDGSVDFVWSFDSFVHMDAETIDAYLGEIRRVLRPGGAAIIHHAGRSHATLWLGCLMYLGWPGRVLYNLVSLRSVADGWRSNMSARRFRALATDRGLDVEDQVQSWGERNEFGVRRFGDVVTVLKKAASAALSIALVGCALTVGRPFDRGAASALAVGTATTETTRAQLGEPWLRRDRDGAEQWIYFWSGEVGAGALAGPFVGRTFEGSPEEQAIVLHFCGGTLRSVRDVARDVPAQNDAIKGPIPACAK